MEKYYGYYKCRNCGAKFIRCEMESFDEVFKSVADLANGAEPVLPKLLSFHFCYKSKTDIISLADFVGFEKETI